jgi:capsular polysaccharide transport system ATP-binding protein
MIELLNLAKSYPTRTGVHHVLKGVHLTVSPGQRIGILGRNGSGKSTLVRILSGAERPTSGVVRRSMSVSWPLAFGGAFQGKLTGLDNFKFICRIYGVDPNARLPYVEDFAELGRYLFEPVKSYSSGMRARLAFAISMSIEFDCFLIDEIIAVGDARFTARCEVELFEKRKDRAFVLVSHEAHNIRERCDSAAVLHNGQMQIFDDVDAAYEFYKRVTYLAESAHT